MAKADIFDKGVIERNFKKLAESGKLSHAYLFFGEGSGDEKFALAESLANFLENGKFKKPEGILREVFVVSPDEKGSIGIDSARYLKRFLWQKASDEGKKRTVIIKNAEALTLQAQNSALKIVEEPPENSLIVFITNNENNLLPALVSRLQKIYFPGFSGAEENSISEDILESDLSEEEIDLFFKNLIGKLAKDPVKNSGKIKEALKRLIFIKQFNTNKRLQLKSLLWKTKE